MADLRCDIEFKSYDGIALRGWFYPARGRDRAPVIVMSHGVSRSILSPGVPRHALYDGSID